MTLQIFVTVVWMNERLFGGQWGWQIRSRSFCLTVPVAKDQEQWLGPGASPCHPEDPGPSETKQRRHEQDFLVRTGLWPVLTTEATEVVTWCDRFQVTYMLILGQLFLVLAVPDVNFMRQKTQRKTPPGGISPNFYPCFSKAELCLIQFTPALSLVVFYNEAV